MTGPPKVELTLMGVDGAQADLIRQACTDAAGAISLNPLDKGLSGARVLLAQWPLEARLTSAPHVLKIGDLTKLRWEASVTEKRVSPVDPLVGHIRLFEDEANSLGLLRQAFLGSPDGQVISLKEWIREQGVPDLVRMRVGNLYNDRMRQWHCAGTTAPPYAVQSFSSAFGDRILRQPDLMRAFDDVGRNALEKSFTAHNFASIDHIEASIRALNNREEGLAQGLVHGDLHAQNVLVSGDKLQLIDFAWAQYGWKALDFLMLECSLKFLVIPDECRIEDLVFLETIIEECASSDLDWSALQERPYSRYLCTFAAALSAIRTEALRWRAVTDFEQYRRGLIVLMACLGTYPGLNRNFLSHSLAYHVSKLS
jgi:hypothetical protein